MMKRRTFIRNSALALAASAMSADLLAKKKKAVGIQLYTLRSVIFKDVKGTLKQLSNWGYTELETFGYNKGQLFGMSAKDFNDYVKSLGMKVTSGHYGIDVVRGDWQKAVDDAKAADQPFMVLPWVAPADRNADSYKRIIEDVNKAAEVTKKAGIQMQYHNHDFEFQPMGDTTPFELLMAGLDPKLVTWELDIYWAIRAGQDLEQLFTKYPGRFQQWHVKDMDKVAPEKNADVGTGSIDFKKLFTMAKKSGLKHWYVEHDTFMTNDPMKSAENDIMYMKSI